MDSSVNAMKIFNLGINTLYMANSMLRENRRNLSSLSKISLDKFVSFLVDDSYLRLGVGGYGGEQKNFLDFCKNLLQKEDISVGILNAHGDEFFGKWCYSDGLIPKSVQKWIDKYDGFYDVLLIHSCNPQHKRPVIRKSITVVPSDIFNMLSSIDLLEHKLVIPGEGYIPVNRKIIQKLPHYNLLNDLRAYIPDN